MEMTLKGYPTVKPFGYPNPSYPRVIVQNDVHHTDGSLLVAKGATGIRVGSCEGSISVLFHEGQDCFISPQGDGLLLHRIPAVCVQSEFPAGSGRFV